jgi:hypothetical protein
MSYRQPAMIRNQAGLNAANEAIEKFNDSLSDMADDLSDMKQRQYCRKNPSAAECKSKKDKDEDDDSDDSNNGNTNTTQGNTTSTNANKNIQSNSKAAITSQIKPPMKVKRGGAQTGGSIQYFSNDMENDMYDNYKKSNYNSANAFGTAAGSNKKNNYKTFYNGED